MTQLSVLLADDHPVFRAGLRQVIEAGGMHRVVAEVNDGRAALSQIEILKPEIAIFDLSMPVLDGFSALQKLREMNVTTRVLIVTMHNDTGYARRAKELGAIGLIAKEDAAGDLLRALNTDAGDFFMSQSVGSSHLHALELPQSYRHEQPDFSSLTPAEQRVLHALSKGLTSKEIGRKLNISHRTVQAHRRNIAEKLDVAGPNQLLQLAIRTDANRFNRGKD